MIEITPENHHKHNPEDKGLFWSDSKEFRDTLSIHFTLNDYLDTMMGTDKVDWGGKYASWLESFGIDSNTDNGWWSYAAVLPENLWLFILDNTLEEGYRPLEVLRSLTPSVEGVSIRCRYKSILKLLCENDIYIPKVDGNG